MKTRLVVALVAGIGCVVVGVMIVRHLSLPQAAPQTVRAERQPKSEQISDQAGPAVAPVEAPAAPAQNTTSSAGTQPTPAGKSPAQSNVKPAAATPQAPQGPVLTDEPIPEPLARAALSFVGADRDAEWVWYRAINDPRLSADARQNLIEDLNEDGFSDPDNPTPYDLPLIESRIALIEQAAPDSMDEVNAAAFKEAYKDLVNMYRSVTGL